MTFCKPRIAGFSSLSTGQSPRAISLAMKILIYSFHIHIKSIYSFNHFCISAKYLSFTYFVQISYCTFWYFISRWVTMFLRLYSDYKTSGKLDSSNFCSDLSSRKRFVERQRIRQISLNFPKGLSLTFSRCLHEHGGVLYLKIIVRRCAIRITLFSPKMSA